MPSVFPVQAWYPLQHDLMYTNHIMDMGDGFEQRINKNLAFSRSNGEGVVASYKGINRFVINFKNAAHINSSSTAPANLIWAFYKARLGGYEAFYYYNPAEMTTIDPTGVETVGRYLVRFQESNLSREMFIRKLFNYGGIALIETRA